MLRFKASAIVHETLYSVEFEHSGGEWVYTEAANKLREYLCGLLNCSYPSIASEMHKSLKCEQIKE